MVLQSTRWYAFGEMAHRPPPPPLSRLELLTKWQQYVNRARSRYELKAAICSELMRECVQAMPSQSTTFDPDGALALHHALQLESEARKDYMRVLRICTELTVHGVIPNEDPH